MKFKRRQSEMQKWLLKGLLLLMISILLQACSGGSRTASATNNSRNANTSNVNGSSNNGTIGNKNCQNSDLGYIYDPSASQSGSFSFQQRVADLVSVGISPESLGEVSGVSGENTGVQIRMKLRFNSGGQIVSGESFLEISIYDSYVGQDDGTGNSVEPIVIYIESVKSGTLNPSSKQLQVVFADQYGEISLQGRVQGEDLMGTVSFTNFVSYDNSSPRSGQLGSFLIPACSIGQ